MVPIDSHTTQARGALLLGLSETGVTSYQKYSIEIRKFLSLARPLDLGAEGRFFEERTAEIAHVA
jgi:hypothetical protein